MKFQKIVLIILLLALAIPVVLVLIPSKPNPPQPPIGDSPKTPSTPPASKIPVYSYEVVHAWPHDTGAFTQGLVVDDGVLYESTGMEGRSNIRIVDVKTGSVLKRVDLAPQYFGEGIDVMNGRLYQLTWQSQVGFVYELPSFRRIDTFSYNGEGWGITHDSASLIMSNGSNVLTYRDPKTLEEKRKLTVVADGFPVDMLNELEYVDGEIWANVWRTERIARIDPATGNVTGWIDLTGILPAQARTGREDVLNGIAYDRKEKKIYVTGKYWPLLFEIKPKRVEKVTT